MTSKIVVNNIESDSGISSVTFTSDIELGTKNLKGHNLESTGIVTAVSFTGSGADLTNLPAANLTGTLPAISGANLTNLPAANLTGTLPAISGANLTGINTAFGSGTSVNTSGIITATAFVPTEGQLSHRNLIINGAMNVAQRGVTSTATGFGSVDRFAVYHSTDDAPTHSQSDVGLSDLPFTEQGITKCLKVTNGNQSSASNAEYVEISYKCEAQDIRNSGWNYQSSSSFITLSYYVRSSVAQTYTAWITNRDGTRKNFVWSYALSANTWTKITKVIPGDSGLTINNDNGAAFELWLQMYYGTNYTQASPPGNNTGGWVNHDNQTVVDNTTTWYLTNDATFELTGVQLEVGTVSTPFEHKSYQDEIMRCYRYYYAHKGMLWGITSAGDHLDLNITFPVPMRATPSRTQVDTSLLFKNRLNQENSTSATTYSYSGVVSPTGDFWVARPGSGDAWGVSYTSSDTHAVYYHVHEGTTSYAWSAEL